MAKAILKKISALEDIANTKSNRDSTTYGIYEPSPDGPKLLRVIKKVSGEWVEVSEEPKISIAKNLEPMLIRPRRFMVVIGGRGSGKSISIGDMLIGEAHDFGVKVGCFREFQNSIKESVHSLIGEEAKRLGVDGFKVQDESISSSSGGYFVFKGLARNVESTKSMFGFNRFWVEEAQTISDHSLKTLTPTMRAKEGRIIFTANPGSSEDPFSQRFITPFQDELLRSGIYEDDLHLVIVMNWRDNPWFPSELEGDRLWDKENLSSALYEWIWEGAFNDSVDDAIIPTEWFDAAIDAHIKLNWKPKGLKVASFDPADTGGDSKGLCLRHGSLVMNIMEKTDGDVNDSADWATDVAIETGADVFTWDGDGLGAGIRRQVTEPFMGKKVEVIQFKGSESPDRPNEMYQGFGSDGVVSGDNLRSNSDTFRNKRAQFYWRLRDRFYNTWRAVEKGEYVNPDDMISLSSDIESMAKLRAEVCRIPRKRNGNGLIQIMTKDEMKSKLKIKSPNMADALMMSMIEWSPVVRPDYSNYEVPCGVF